MIGMDEMVPGPGRIAACAQRLVVAARASGSSTAEGVDVQRSRVYAAQHLVTGLLSGSTEIEAFGRRMSAPAEIRYSTLADVQAYVDHVAGPGQITVRVGRSDLRTRAYARGSTITLPSRDAGEFAWRQLVILHEVAHVRTRDQHGPEFVAEFCRLVRAQMGEEAHWLLRCAMYEHHVAIEETP